LPDDEMMPGVKAPTFWEKLNAKIGGIDMNLGNVAGLGALGLGGLSIAKFLDKTDYSQQKKDIGRAIAGQKASAMHDIDRRVAGAKQSAYGNLAARGLSTAGQTFGALADIDLKGAELAGDVASQYDSQLAEAMGMFSELEEQQKFKWADVGDLALTASTLLL